MIEAFWYLSAGAAIVGLLAGCDWDESPVGYVVAVAFWPFIAITVAASMVRDSVIAARETSE